MTHFPTIKQLKYLAAVVEHKHFGKAAKACFISQSTLSAGIAELEHILGVTLIERDQKGMKLLPIGEQINQRAREILANMKDLVDSAKAAQEPFSNELKLGVIPTIAPFILPKIMSHIRVRYPNFKIFIREAMSAPLTDELLSGQLDLLLLALPYPVERVSTYPLFRDEFLLAAPEGHLLATQPTVTINDIKGHDILLLEDGHCIRDHALDACLMRSEDLKIPYQATSLSTVTQMVANDMGITILPKMAIDANLVKGTQVKAIPFKEQDIYRMIGLMWRQQTPRINEFKAFGKVIAEVVNGSSFAASDLGATGSRRLSGKTSL